MDFWRFEKKQITNIIPAPRTCHSERACSKQAHLGFRHPGSRAVGTECGGIDARASKTGWIKIEIMKENLGLKPFTTGLQLVGSKLICVCIKQSVCVCVTQLYSSGHLQWYFTLRILITYIHFKCIHIRIPTYVL